MRFTPLSDWHIVPLLLLSTGYQTDKPSRGARGLPTGTPIKHSGGEEENEDSQCDDETGHEDRFEPIVVAAVGRCGPCAGPDHRHGVVVYRSLRCHRLKSLQCRTSVRTHRRGSGVAFFTSRWIMCPGYRARTATYAPARSSTLRPVMHVPRTHRSGSPPRRPSCGHCAGWVVKTLRTSIPTRPSKACWWTLAVGEPGAALSRSFTAARPVGTSNSRCRPVSVVALSGLQSPFDRRCSPGS